MRILFSLLLFIIFTSCNQENKNSERTKNFEDLKTGDIVLISDLPELFTKIQNKQLRFNKFGISSNGNDLVTFPAKNGKYAIEYAIVDESQTQWFEKLKKYARSKFYKVEIVEYQAPPNYKSELPKPKMTIETPFNDVQTYDMTKDIMKNVFGNDEKTIYRIITF